MEINLHYASRFDEKQIMELRNMGIDLDIDELSDFVCFDIFQNSEQHLRLKEKFPNISNPVKWYVFSEEEMQEAEWFTMRSTNEKLEDSCPEKTFSYSCYASNYYNPPLKFDLYSHQTQVAPFYFSKPVKWGRNFFYSCSDKGQDTFFCSETASKLMLQHGLKGMEFLPVLSKKTNKPMPDIYQFNVTNMIPDSSFHVVGASGICTCPVCGKSRYVVNSLSRPSVDKSVLGEQDFYVTDMIQTYNGPCFPSPFYIVSKRACDFFRKYRFDRTLELFPLLTY